MEEEREIHYSGTVEEYIENLIEHDRPFPNYYNCKYLFLDENKNNYLLERLRYNGKYIPPRAFYGCCTLRRVTFSQSVNIGALAFAYCDNLREVIIEGKNFSFEIQPGNMSFPNSEKTEIILEDKRAVEFLLYIYPLLLWTTNIEFTYKNFDLRELDNMDIKTLSKILKEDT